MIKADIRGLRRFVWRLGQQVGQGDDAVKGVRNSWPHAVAAKDDWPAVARSSSAVR